MKKFKHLDLVSAAGAAFSSQADPSTNPYEPATLTSEPVEQAQNELAELMKIAVDDKGRLITDIILKDPALTKEVLNISMLTNFLGFVARH